jgi:hypothetical protein
VERVAKSPEIGRAALNRMEIWHNNWRYEMRCRKLFLSWSVLLVGLGFAGTVSADQMNGRYQVQGLFSETGAAGVYLKEGLPQCLFNLMYINLGSPEGNAMLALLTTAKVSRMTVTRLDYTRDANTTRCILTGVHVE